MVSHLLKDNIYDIIVYCLKTRQRFTDFEFLHPSDGVDEKGEQLIFWKRPCEIEPKPKFTIDGASRGDVKQGGLGDCWAISAMASLADRPDLLEIVIPELQSQDLYGKYYCGLLYFRFYSFGNWTEILIDDYLPFYGHNKLIFARSPNIYGKEGEIREWWLPLLEKAYAKLEGGYENLNGGFTAVSLTALTGGFCEEINLTEARGNEEKLCEILQLMKETWDHGGLICLGTENKSYNNGIVKRHAYSVSKIVDVRGFRTLIKIRNPWGKTEWTGNVLQKYSDWQRAPQFLMKEIGYKNGKDAEDDGEFVMSIEDMIRHFGKVTLCNQRQMLLAANWNINQHRSMWVVGCNDGGAMGNINFPANPQFPLAIDTKSNIRIDLEQKVTGKTCHSLGLYVFKDKNLRKKNGRITNFPFQPIMKSITFKCRRIIYIKGVLSKGSYVIVPCTFHTNVQAEFLLTISVQQQAQ